jgi:hypothetical protein
MTVALQRALTHRATDRATASSSTTVTSATVSGRSNSTWKEPRGSVAVNQAGKQQAGKAGGPLPVGPPPRLRGCRPAVCVRWALLLRHCSASARSNSAPTPLRRRPQRPHVKGEWGGRRLHHRGRPLVGLVRRLRSDSAPPRLRSDFVVGLVRRWGLARAAGALAGPALGEGPRHAPLLAAHRGREHQARERQPPRARPHPEPAPPPKCPHFPHTRAKAPRFSTPTHLRPTPRTLLCTPPLGGDSGGRAGGRTVALGASWVGGFGCAPQPWPGRAGGNGLQRETIRLTT